MHMHLDLSTVCIISSVSDEVLSIINFIHSELHADTLAHIIAQDTLRELSML